MGDPIVLLPLACLASGAFGLTLIARFVTRNNGLLSICAASTFLGGLAGLGLLGVRTVTAWRAGSALPAWGSLMAGGAFLQAEPGALYLIGIALGLGFLIAIYSGRYLALDDRYITYYPLLLTLVAATAGMVLAADLFNLYLACELMAISAYVLVAFRRHTDTAVEAGLKYLVMGTVGTIAMLMGIALIYRQTGRLEILQPAAITGVWGRLGVAMLLAGLWVKSGLVPAHTWLPDAQGRAPSSVSAMLSGVVDQSCLYVLIKVSLSLGLPARVLGLVLLVAALVNMIVGNLLALVQTNTKRLLAYSTIAQMGYVMFAFGLGLRYGLVGAMEVGFFLLMGHALMKGLAFLSKGVCHFYLASTTVAQLRGTRAQLPLVSLTFAVALAGLAGVPPLAGFAGKWFVLAEALRAADALAVVGVVLFLLNTLLALGYYLPVIAMLFAPAIGREERVAISPYMVVPLLTMAGIVLAVGLMPGPWLDWGRAAGAYLLSLGR